MITDHFDKFINSVSENNHICNILTNSLSRDIEKYKSEDSRFFSGNLYLANDPFSLDNKPKYLSDIFGFYYCRNYEVFECYWKDIFSYCLFQKYSGDFFFLQKFLKGGEEFKSKISLNFHYEGFRSSLNSSNDNYLKLLMEIVAIDHPNRTKVKSDNKYFIEFYSSLRHHLVHVNSGFGNSNTLKFSQYLFQDFKSTISSFQSIEFDNKIFKRAYEALINKAYQFYKLSCEFLEIENEIINK